MTFQRTRLLRRWSIFKNWLNVRNLYWAKVLHNYGVKPSRTFQSVEGSLRLPHLGVALQKDKHEFIIEGYDLAVALQSVGARFELDLRGNIVVTVQETKAILACKEDLYILVELHIAGVYDFSTSGDYVLIDIGMNVGLASIFFHSVVKAPLIVGFEPVKSTYERALENFKLNQIPESDIEAHNIGIADHDGTFEAEFNDTVRGLTSIFGMREDRKAYLECKKETLHVRDVVSVIDEIVHRHPNKRMLMKIDCEGAEYQIVDRLIDTGRINSIEWIMMEWHRIPGGVQPTVLREKLIQTGFTCIMTERLTADGSMLYAARVVSPSQLDSAGVM